MPALADHQSSKTVKLLFLGDSGAGKTGALASLAAAGYNLRILDVDNGVDVLANLLRDAKAYPKGALERVSYVTLTDPMKNVGGRLIPKSATVWQRAMNLLDNWKDGEISLGPIASWTEQDVLVIDSLTMLSNAAMQFILALNARGGQQPHQSDWYGAQGLIEGLLQKLYDEGIRCNVVLVSHIQYFGEDNAPLKGYPSGPGKALSPKIGRYFNSMIMAKTMGSGQSVKRKLITTSTPMVELKTSAPTRVKQEYELASGLAEFFRDVRGASAIEAPKPGQEPQPAPSGAPAAPAALALGLPAN